MSLVTEIDIKEKGRWIIATISKGYTFGSTETVTATKLHDLADLATVTGIVNADIAAGAAIDSTKINLSSAGYLTSGQATATITGDWTFQGDNTFAGTTIADLGTVTTAIISSADINGGTIDGATVGANSASTVKATSLQLATGATVTGILDEDDMATDSATQLATQQSIKKYVDDEISGITAPAMVLLSTTTVTAADNSGDIAITAGKRYMVFFNFIAGLDDITMEIRFDSDTGASDYAWILRVIAYSATPSETITGDDADDSIPIGTINGQNHMVGHFILDATQATNIIFLNGQLDASNASAAQENRIFTGRYVDAGTLTNFEFFANHAFTGTIKTYEIT